MQNILLPLALLLFIGCSKEFEPELKKGWKAYTFPSKRLVLEFDGREKNIELPGDEKITYRYAQWTKFQDRVLVTQIIGTDSCADYQILAVDTTGVIMDTVYTAPPNTALNFKLAPNDTLLLLKTYHDDCEESVDFQYSFYNRYLKKAVLDTIAVDNARGILLLETVWSPDSKKVIIQEWSGRKTKGFTYDLVTKDTAYIDKGSNFIWSPTDNDLVTYIKDYSIYSKNMKNRETDLIFNGKEKKGATAFRWSPSGDFLMIHVQGYLLNVKAAPLQSHNIIYLSLPDKIESRTFYDDQHIASWKDGATVFKEIPAVAGDTLK